MTPSGLRWGLLLLFLIPIADPTSPFTLADDYGTVVAVLVGSAAVCALLLSRLARPARESLWAWVLLGLFLHGYYVRSFLFAADVTRVGFIGENPELNWVSLASIAEGLPYIAAAFTAVCLAAWLALTFVPTVPPLPEPDAGREVVANLMVATVLLVALAAGVIQARLGIGVMGAETDDPLPLRLGTIIIRVRTDLAPALVLLGVWLTDRSPRLAVRTPSLAALVILGALDSVVTTSRGGLLKLVLPLLFLWLLTGRLTAQRARFLALAVVAAVLLHPFASALRDARAQSSSSGASWGTLASAAATAWGGDFFGSASASGQRVVERVTGAEGVWFALGDMPNGIDLGRLGGHVFEESLTLHYTRQVVGVTRSGDFRSPGLVGFAMMIGGLQGAAILSFLFVLAVRAVWGALARLKTSPVALALWAMATLSLAMEGTFPPGGVIMPLAGIAAAEVVSRLFLGSATGDAPLRSGAVLEARKRFAQ